MRAEIRLRCEGETRGDARHAAYRKGEIVGPGAESLSGTVTDLSCSGFRILIDAPLMPDSVVWARIGGEGPFMARVVWHDGVAAGCAFAARLQPGLVGRLLAG